MTDRPTFYDLPPVGVLDFGRMVEWECPIIPCDKRVLVADLAAKLHSGPLALRLGESLGDHPHPDPQVRDKLMNAEAELYAHIGHDHDWSAILLAMAASEAIYDEQIADQNRENERAWGFTRMLLKRLEEIHQAIETFELESATVPAIEALVTSLKVFSVPPAYSGPLEPEGIKDMGPLTIHGIEACRSIRHCVTWGFCHRCAPEFARVVGERWQQHSEADKTASPSETYLAIIRDAQKEQQA